MTYKPGTRDSTFVTLVHTALRVDGARLDGAVTAVGLEDQTGKLAGIRAFFEHHCTQHELHHRHEDALLFPAVAAKVGPDRMRVRELEAHTKSLRWP